MDAITVWTAVSAVGTVCLGGATVWLAGTTKALVRRNAELVEESKLSRDHWSTMAIEASRARLDAKAPSVYVTAELDEQSPRMPSTVGGVAQPCPPTKWTFSRDRAVRLVVRCTVRVYNSGTGPVTVRARGRIVETLTSEREGSRERLVEELRIHLNGDCARMIVFEANSTLEEWATDWSARAIDEFSIVDSINEIEVYDDDDNGVTDSWVIILSGSPIVPEPGNEAGWVLRDPAHPLTKFFVQGLGPSHRQRKYYLSKRLGLELPKPPGLEKFLETPPSLADLYHLDGPEERQELE